MKEGSVGCVLMKVALVLSKDDYSSERVINKNSNAQES